MFTLDIDYFNDNDRMVLISLKMCMNNMHGLQGMYIILTSYILRLDSMLHITH